MFGIIFALLFIAVLVLISCVNIVPQAYAYVVERLGQFQDVWEAGLHLKVPFLDRVVRRVSLKEQIADFPPQPVITKDNVTIDINTVVYFSVTDPKLYTYGVEQPILAIENITATTLRNVVGELELDQTLTSRDVINTKLRVIIDEATDPWGIKVNRVELKDISVPASIQNEMEKQMSAERSKRAAILEAEGRKQSAILLAEGEKQKAILEAQAKKEALIVEADGIKAAEILKAEGEAEAIERINQAKAKAFEHLNKVGIKPEVLQLRSYEALEKVADGQATKIIVPSNVQDMTTRDVLFNEVGLDNTKNKK